jgi:outer membrane lipoprotein-sorting protein
MKKLIFLLSALLIVASVSAQSNKEEIELMQAAFGMEKKAMMEEFVQVDPAQRDAFWALYDEYETARKDLAKRRIDLLNQYVINYDKMTNEFADSWTAEVMALGKKTDALLAGYYKKVKKVTNPVVALQFLQVENYILSGIRVMILEELPLPELR